MTIYFSLLSYISTSLASCIVTLRDLTCSHHHEMGSYAVHTSVTSSFGLAPLSDTACLPQRPFPFPLSLHPSPLSLTGRVHFTIITSVLVIMTPRYENANFVYITCIHLILIYNCDVLNIIVTYMYIPQPQLDLADTRVWFTYTIGPTNVQ